MRNLTVLVIFALIGCMYAISPQEIGNCFYSCNYNNDFKCQKLLKNIIPGKTEEVKEYMQKDEKCKKALKTNWKKAISQASIEAAACN